MLCSNETEISFEKKSECVEKRNLDLKKKKKRDLEETLKRAEVRTLATLERRLRIEHGQSRRIINDDDDGNKSDLLLPYLETQARPSIQTYS